MTIPISLHRITSLIFPTVLLLYILHIATSSIHIHQLHFPFSTYLRIFSLDEERGVGTWFSALLHLLAAFSCYCASRVASTKDDQRHWFLIAAILCFSSLEEVIGLHEDSSLHLTSRFELPIYLRWAWVLFATPIVLALAAYFSSWILRLPANLRNNVCFAAFLFITGAIGMEMIGSALFHRGGGNTYSLVLAEGLEESLEMFGITWMVRTASIYLGQSPNELSFRIAS